MKKFVKKIYICLFEPRKMGFFFPEKIYKSVIQLLIMMLFVVCPLVIQGGFNDEISQTSKKFIQEYFMEDLIETDVVLRDNVLTGTNDYTFVLPEAIVYINPLDKVMEADVSDYPLSHIIEFRSDRIDILFMGRVIESMGYADYNVGEIDFDKILRVDYLEFDKFMSVLNDTFQMIHIRCVVINSVESLFSIITSTAIAVFILAVISKIFNPMVKFRFRLKGAIDAQFISVLFTFLMILYNMKFFKYIGLFFSAVYLIRALMAVVKIEVRRQPNNPGGGE